MSHMVLAAICGGVSWFAIAVAVGICHGRAIRLREQRR